jgi:16S rRNA (uracil1498-N3)-methyltransferase
VLAEEESRHIQKVLRLAAGDTIQLTDGKGFLYKAQLLIPQGKNTAFKVINKIFVAPKNYSIHIAIAPTKNADRIEWFVEKAVELGIQQISFIECANSERKSINIERIEKKAISAMKQSGQYYLPVINDLVSFNQFVNSCREEERFIGFVDEDNQQQLFNIAKPTTNSLVLIGPEGDFSKDELALALNYNFKEISLGSTRLRTETAGIAACHILNLINT